MIFPFPGELFRIFDPFQIVAAPFKQRREFAFREISFVGPGITFRQTQMPEKLNENNVIALLICVRRDATLIGKTFSGGFSKKVGNLIFGIAESSKSAGA